MISKALARRQPVSGETEEPTALSFSAGDRPEPAAEKLRAQHVWGASPAGARYAAGLQPGTKEFFESTAARRNEIEMASVLKLIPFQSCAGLRVLELGCGAGYDALAFCQAGADYAGIDLTGENTIRTRKHLALYGYAARVLQGDAERLAFPDRSFQFVFSNGVLHHTPDMAASFREAHRVLSANGRFWVIVYNRRSAFYALYLYLFQHILKRGYRECSFRQRLGRIEYTSSGELPLINVYSSKEVVTLLRAAGFSSIRCWIRKLNAEDLPCQRLWRRVPQSILDWFGRAVGWYIIAEGVRRS
jgi:ubiquinone/menaquinone biosynthesis C-methylase UbiE